MPGRHVFVTDEVLTAANVNDYLMDQTVPRFASAAARDVQWPSPPSGAMCITTDTNSRWQRVGANWRHVDQIDSTTAVVRVGGKLANGTTVLQPNADDAGKLWNTISGATVAPFNSGLLFECGNNVYTLDASGFQNIYFKRAFASILGVWLMIHGNANYIVTVGDPPTYLDGSHVGFFVRTAHTGAPLAGSNVRINHVVIGT